jgi:hypothetical protein
MAMAGPMVEASAVDQSIGPYLSTGCSPLTAYKKTAQAHRGVWEIDAFYTPTPVDGDNRPFFPYSLLCAEHAAKMKQKSEEK